MGGARAAWGTAAGAWEGPGPTGSQDCARKQHSQAEQGRGGAVGRRQQGQWITPQGLHPGRGPRPLVG